MSVEPETKGVPRRDFILLPLISILTILVMTGVAEYATRRMWAEKLTDDCAYHSNRLGDRRKANCVTRMKNLEGPWVEYRTNDCGYRGASSCGPKPAGTVRVAILGTSAAFGLHLPYDEYFANLAAPQLSRMWHKKVEFENLGDAGPEWSKSNLLLDEVLSMKPDAVIYMVVPFDLNRMDYVLDKKPKSCVTPAAAPKKTNWTWTDVRVAARESRLLLVAQHFMLRDENFFLRAFESYADPDDVSRQPTPPLVETRFERMDMMVGKLAERMRAARVPCFLIALPNRVQCALISKNIQLPHMDAYVFARRMKEIAEKNGVNYIDMVPEIQKRPTAENMFYPVDGHPNGAAHTLMAHVMVDYFARHPGVPREGINIATR